MTEDKFPHVVTAGTKVIEQFRIVSRCAGAPDWRFRSFTGAGPHENIDRAIAAKERAIEESPGDWGFKIERMERTVIETDWEDA